MIVDDRKLSAILRDIDRAHDRLTRGRALSAADREAAAKYTKSAGDSLAKLLFRLPPRDTPKG